jgi:hypothetical protein
MFEEIVSWQNICQAYIDLYQKLTEKNKAYSYSSTDAQSLFDIETDCERILQEVQKEMCQNAPLKPAKYIQIPKKNGGIRGIYLLPIKDRIKAQAVYRVLNPHLEKIYSAYLYSFRPKYPSYYASRALRRYYLRNYGKNENYILKMDFTNYSDHIDHNILLNLLKSHGVDDRTLLIFKSFLRQPFIHNGAIMTPVVGIKQGMLLSTPAVNIYADHMDKHIGPQVKFYRRIGDDFILIDRHKELLEKMKDYISNEAERSKLKINVDKTRFCRLEEDFQFLGLSYSKGLISLPEKTIENMTCKWKKKFVYNENLPLLHKLKNIKRFFCNDKYLNTQNEKNYLLNYVRSFNLVNDSRQISHVSKKLFAILSTYLTGGTSFKKMKKTKAILKNHPIPSLSKIHNLYTNGKRVYR